eukprot:8055899-Karenia_brevis.AAC.1
MLAKLEPSYAKSEQDVDKFGLQSLQNLDAICRWRHDLSQDELTYIPKRQNTRWNAAGWKGPT